MSTVSDHVEAWIPSTDTFAMRLAMVRTHEGWDRKEAALACGFPSQTWRNWEAGKHPRDMVGVCRAISDRTGCDLHWLLTGEDHYALAGSQNLKFEQEELDLPGFPEAM